MGCPNFDLEQVPMERYSSRALDDPRSVIVMVDIDGVTASADGTHYRSVSLD